MSGKKRNKLRRFFIILNIIVVLLYLLVCLVPFLDGDRFWFIAILGLALPVLFVFIILFLIILLLMKSKWIILSLAALLISWQQLSVVFAFRTEKEFHTDKTEGTLRILSWNVSQWTEGTYSMGKSGSNSFRELMMELIREQNADVLCLQEFFECYDLSLFQSNIPAMKNLGYPYYYFFPSIKIYENNFQFGMAIFSRYPIVDSGHVLSPVGVRSEGLSYADVKMNDQRFRIFTAHLESVGLNAQDYEGSGNPEISGSKFKTIIKEFQFRSRQAEMVRDHIRESPYPAVVCCDLDDVPNSYAYFTVKGKLQDAFLQKGSGFGRTFRFISPTLRIDYIFADRKFQVDQFKRLKVPYSDHYPLIADLILK